MAARPSSQELGRALVRFNANVLGLMAALIAAVGVVVSTLGLLLQGGENVGTMLSTLGSFFPGYQMSVGGAFFASSLRRDTCPSWNRPFPKLGRSRLGNTAAWVPSAFKNKPALERSFA